MAGPVAPPSGSIALPNSNALQKANVLQASADRVVQQQAHQQEASYKVRGIMTASGGMKLFLVVMVTKTRWIGQISRVAEA